MRIRAWTNWLPIANQRLGPESIDAVGTESTVLPYTKFQRIFVIRTDCLTQRIYLCSRILSEIKQLFFDTHGLCVTTKIP